MSEALAVDTGEGTPLNLSIVASKDDDGKDDDISHLASLAEVASESDAGRSQLHSPAEITPEQMHKYNLSLEDSDAEDDEMEVHVPYSPEGRGSSPSNFNYVTESEMTFGRRLAQRLSASSCLGKLYDPSKNIEPTIVVSAASNLSLGDEERLGVQDHGILLPPQLDKAWQFFEHYALPRCFVGVKQNSVISASPNQKQRYYRAEPGEAGHQTRLYPIWRTPLEDMADFGIGVGMYFSMIRYLAVMCFIAGCISIPNIIFFQSDQYSDGQKGISSFKNLGSAICTRTAYQPCPSCTVDDMKERGNGWIIEGSSPDPDNDTTVMFIKKNQCAINELFGSISLSIVFFVTLSMFIFIFNQRRMRFKLDAQDHTTADYSIHISNPPYNAKDPKNWKEFFEKRFDDLHVTLCTVVLKNDELIAKMAERQKLLAKLKSRLPNHFKFCSADLETTVLQCSEPGVISRLLCCSVGPKELYDKILKIDVEIEQVSSSDFPTSGVFVTFETEDMQQRVLAEMTFPSLCNNVVDSKFKWGGHVVLEIDEPDEPSSIRWADIDETLGTRVRQRIVSFLFTIGLIIFGAYCITWVHNNEPSNTAYLIVAFNIFTPFVVRMVSSYESYYSQTSYAASVYLKITAFRWINTAIVTAVITPFTDTLRDGHLISAISTLFIAELIQRPMFQLVDLLGTIKRHILAPRAKNQHKMNLLLGGSEYSIGERYTEVTKLLFLTCFYCTLYPAAWFFAALILTVYYWLDKFCVLRKWRQGPKINAKLSIVSTYFFLACIAVLAVTTAYNVARFPFDDACETAEEVPSSYVGDYINEAQEFMFTISDSDTVYKVCDQNMYGYPQSFPPIPYFQPEGEEWMDITQLKFAPITGWVAVGVLSSAVLFAIIKLVVKIILPLFTKTYRASTSQQNYPFSLILADKYLEIEAYIPQIKIPGNEFPSILCDIDGIDKDLIGWRGHSKDDFSSHNLIHDIPKVLKRNNSPRSLSEETNPIFAIVKQWTPTDDYNSSVDDYTTESPSSSSSKFAKFLFQ